MALSRGSRSGQAHQRPDHLAAGARPRDLCLSGSGGDCHRLRRSGWARAPPLPSLFPASACHLDELAWQCRPGVIPLGGAGRGLVVVFEWSSRDEPTRSTKGTAQVGRSCTLRRRETGVASTEARAFKAAFRTGHSCRCKRIGTPPRPRGTRLPTRRLIMTATWRARARRRATRPSSSRATITSGGLDPRQNSAVQPALGLPWKGNRGATTRSSSARGSRGAAWYYRSPRR